MTVFGGMAVNTEAPESSVPRPDVIGDSILWVLSHRDDGSLVSEKNLSYRDLAVDVMKLLQIEYSTRFIWTFHGMLNRLEDENSIVPTLVHDASAYYAITSDGASILEKHENE